MSETPDWDYSKRPVHEIDSLRSEVAQLKLQVGVLQKLLRRALDAVRDHDFPKGHKYDLLCNELMAVTLGDQFVDKRKCECVWLDGGIVGEYRDPKVPCAVHDKPGHPR